MLESCRPFSIPLVKTGWKRGPLKDFCSLNPVSSSKDQIGSKVEYSGFWKRKGLNTGIASAILDSSCQITNERLLAPGYGPVDCVSPLKAQVGSKNPILGLWRRRSLNVGILRPIRESSCKMKQEMWHPTCHGPFNAASTLEAPINPKSAPGTSLLASGKGRVWMSRF